MLDLKQYHTVANLKAYSTLAFLLLGHTLYGGNALRILDKLKKSSKQICMDLIETFLFLSKHTVNLELKFSPIYKRN